MKLQQRPWGVPAIQLPLYKTSIEESYDEAEHYFIIQAEPQFQSLAWITCGPAFGILALVGLGLGAFMLEINTYNMTVKAGMGCALFIMPAIGWAGGGWLVNHIAQKSLHNHAQAHLEKIDLKLNKVNQTLQIDDQPALNFDDIKAIRLMSDEGLYHNPNAEITPMQNLVLETSRGPVKVLPKTIGSIQQKLQLQSQLETLTGVSSS